MQIRFLAALIPVPHRFDFALRVRRKPRVFSVSLCESSDSETKNYALLFFCIFLALTLLMERSIQTHFRRL